MIKDKTLVAALPTAKVLFLSHSHPFKRKKVHIKNTNYPKNPYYKSTTAGGLF